jgi:hypothetical protein
MKPLDSKTLVSALALVALLATPALAKSRKHPAVHGQGVYNSAGPGLYNSVPPNAFGATAVEADGRIIGADPDPQIRTQLLRDFGSSIGAY